MLGFIVSPLRALSGSPLRSLRSITLSVLAIAVGGRAGLTVHGVGLPGHFLAKAIDDDEEVISD